MAAVAQGDVVRAENVDYSEMRAALRSTGAAFASLVRDVTEEAAAGPVPGLTWTVAETAAHMLAILRRGTGDRRRADSLAGLVELNAVTIDEIPTRHPAELASAIAEESAALGGMLDAMDGETAASIALNLHAGVRTDVPTGLSYILFDLMVHGWDIAVATGARWPIDERHAALDLHACLPIFEPWVKREVLGGAQHHLAVAFPDDPYAIVVQVGDGSYRAQNRPVADVEDEHARVDPVDALLALAGRKTSTSPTARQLASLYEPI